RRASRIARGDRHRRECVWRRAQLAYVERFRNLLAMAAPLSGRHDAQHRARVRTRSAGAHLGNACAARASSARVAAAARSGGALFLVDNPRRNRSAAEIREEDICMMNRHHLYVALAVTALHMLGASASHAQQPAVAPLPPQPVVTVTASATAPLNN